MKSLPLLTFTSLLISSAPVFGQSVPIDLRDWTQESFLPSGDWNVQLDGEAVLQSINGAPTFFVSPNNTIDTSFNGKFAVETNSDNDWIGFVFGYQSPISSNNDEPNDFNFFLFDWKQEDQTVGNRLGEEGFTLSLVNGIPQNNSGNPATSSELDSGDVPWWNHSDPAQQFVKTDFGSTRGWDDGVEYDFVLLYQTNRIKIDIQGGTTGDFASKQTIFDFSPSDFGLTSFESGKFGFYNYSQENVRYQGFTQTPEPPEPPETPKTTSESSTFIGLLTICGIALGISKKK